MLVSTGTDYAARAILDLAQHYDMGPVRSSQIAKRQHIPEPFLEQLMTALRKAGIVRSTRGPHGGHELTLSPSDLTLRAVVEAVEGPIEPKRAATAGTQAAAGQPTVLREAWAEVADAYVAALNRITFDSLLERNEQFEGRAVYRI